MLKGTEVKSLRNGKANLVDSYAIIDDAEAWLLNFHIDAYTPATQFNHHPMRKRKLLLHKKEISRIKKDLAEYQEMERKGEKVVEGKISFGSRSAEIIYGEPSNHIRRCE